MPEGKRAGIGLREVARAAGVSTATVSNTLNRPHLVAEATQARVRAAIDLLTFVPNQGAASLRSGSSRLLGLVVPDITNPFYAEIARGVTDAADSVRYAVVLCNSQDDPARENRHVELLAQHRAAGALVVPIGADRSRLERLRRLGSHLVLVDRVVPEHIGCSTSIDDVSGGQLATQHLLSGSTAPVLALVNGPSNIPQCANRRTGMSWAMKAAGIESELSEFVVAEMTLGAGVSVGQRIAELPSRPTGIFCTNDQLAAGVIRGLLQHGVDVPGDIAVVGYGNLTIADQGPIPLTTVEQPMYELGQVAVAKLLAEVADLDGTHRHSSTVFVPSMVIRQSAP
jgi:LacI family transcriptional regulator